MEDRSLPNPRFKQFIQVADSNGKIIGFKIPNNDFLFQYDSDGGWEDQKGDYYDKDGIYQSDDQSQQQQQQLGLHDIEDEEIDEIERQLLAQDLGRPIKKPKQNTKPEKQVNIFEELAQKYFNLKKDVKEQLPKELIIYFKMKINKFQKVQPIIQKQTGRQKKNQKIQLLRKQLNEKRNQLLSKDKWLNIPKVYLNFSGESEVTEKKTYYDRYWFGFVRAQSKQQYLNFIQDIDKSQVFNLLQSKTLFCLKSKFYLKKQQQTQKKTLKDLRENVQTLQQNQYAILQLNNLPQRFAISFIYDLVDFVGGAYDDIQKVEIINDFDAQVHVFKKTALKLVNAQAYNHSKGQYIQLNFKGKEKRKSQKQRRFYLIKVSSHYKIHQCQLFDTLLITNTIDGVTKNWTYEQQKKQGYRFGLGSIDALRQVLMFRGQTMDITGVSPFIPTS